MAITKKIKKTFDLVKKGESVSKAMIKAGYSKTISRVPKKVTERKGWQELMEKELPDEFLAKVHREGLKAKYKDKPDYSVRHKYLETAYKIKNKIPKEVNSIGVAVQVNVDKIRNEYE